MTTPCYSRHFRQRSSLSRQSHYHSAKNGKVASVSVSAHPPNSKPAPIPLPSTHIPRTKSELQFCEDTATAEWRDLCMFHRLVSGIRERQHRQLAVQRQHDIAEQEKARGGPFKLTSSSRSPVLQTERCIDNIICTRHKRAPEPVVETQLVTPYESPRDMMQSEEPAARSTSDCRQPMHLKSVLRQASDIAQETVEDWSLEGYDNTPTPSLPSHANLPARVEVDNQDEDDEEIFSLDL